MLRRRTVVSRLRKLVASAAVLTCAAAAFAGIERPSAAAAPPGLPSDALPAVFAQGGTSRYRDTIQWLQWADYGSNFAGKTKPNVPVLDYGQRKTFTNYRDMGEAGYLVTTCNLSNLKHIGHQRGFPDDLARGPLVATIPGTWAGDILDNLYNIGGAGGWSDGGSEWHAGLSYPANYVNNNQMVIGLANGYAYNGDKTWDGKDKNDRRADRTPTGGYSRISFDVSCSAALQAPDGSSTPVALNGLVFADAEASNPSGSGDPFDGEWIQAQVPRDQRVTWRLLDGGRSTNCLDTRHHPRNSVEREPHSAAGQHGAGVRLSEWRRLLQAQRYRRAGGLHVHGGSHQCHHHHAGIRLLRRRPGPGPGHRLR